MTKEDFNAGSPFSCWLKEEVIGEISDYLNNLSDNNLIKKHNITVDENSIDYVMNNTKSLDDYKDLRVVAVDIIRKKLDETFEK